MSPIFSTPHANRRYDSHSYCNLYRYRSQPWQHYLRNLLKKKNKKITKTPDKRVPKTQKHPPSQQKKALACSITQLLYLGTRLFILEKESLLRSSSHSCGALYHRNLFLCSSRSENSLRRIYVHVHGHHHQLLSWL